MGVQAPIEQLNGAAISSADTTSAGPSETSRAEGGRWNAWTRIAFRLCFIYFALYVLITQMLSSYFVFIPLPDELGVFWPLRNVIEWTARHVFHVTQALVMTGSGSGDKAFDWVEAFCILTLAIFTTAIWTTLDRKSESYPQLNKWFRVFLRFALATTMLTYGVDKAIPLQMPFPSLSRLMEPYGNFSPMGVLWYSIGAAKGYEIFVGCMEILGGVLLLFPRTTVLGALVCLGDTIEVFTLNMTYDVPVKLFSFHLILMSLIVLAPNLGRVAKFFFRGSAEAVKREPELFRSRRANRISLAVQVLFGFTALISFFYYARKNYYVFGAGAPRSELYGIWNVTSFTVDGLDHPALLTDTTRWRRAMFSSPQFMSFQGMDDALHIYGSKLDMNAHTLALTKPSDEKWKADFSVELPEPGKLSLEGQMDGHTIRAKFELFDHKKLLLISRGFHWIQEYPFNR
jgi:uncharacterized membrane protein YphA (DoxX/SURF4 family)